MSVLIQQNRSHSAQLLRHLVDLVPGEGALRIGDFAVAPRAGTPNMSVDVAPGSAVVPAAVAARGRYMVVSDAVVNVPITAAPGAGSSRADLIVARVADTQYGDSSDALVLESLAGAPAAGTPADPVVPDGSIVLARVLVPAEAPAVTASDITDRRTFASPTVWLSGGALPSGGSPGQVAVGSDGTPHWRTDSGWVAGVSAGLFGAREAAISSFQVPASVVTVTGSMLSIPQPSGAVSVHASFDGRCAESGVVEIFAQVSFDGGLSWVDGMTSRQSTDGSSPQAISCHATKTGVPSGQVRCRLRAQRIGGASSAALTGQWSMIVQPAGV